MKLSLALRTESIGSIPTSASLVFFAAFANSPAAKSCSSLAAMALLLCVSCRALRA